MSRYEAPNRPHIDLLRPVATEYALVERYFQHAALYRDSVNGSRFHALDDAVDKLNGADSGFGLALWH